MAEHGSGRSVQGSRLTKTAQTRRAVVLRVARHRGELRHDHHQLARPFSMSKGPIGASANRCTLTREWHLAA